MNRTRFFVEPTSFLRLFVLNTSRPLLANNAPLRQAINYAIDRPALLRQFGPLAGTPVDHYLPPGVPGYRNEHVFPVGEPDVQKARALARGHRRSGTLVLYVNDRPGVPEQAQIVKRDLARIGLDVEIRTFPSGALYFQKLANPKEPFDMAWIGLGFTSPDPGIVLDELFDGTTLGTGDVSHFDSPVWNAALRKASLLTGQARYRAFGGLDIDLAREQAPSVAYGVDNALTLVSARTGCVIVNPFLDLAAVCVK